jgi:hypothetical protein
MNKLFEAFLKSHHALENYLGVAKEGESLEHIAIMSGDGFEYWYDLFERYEYVLNAAPRERFVFLLGSMSADTFQIESGMGHTKLSGNIDGKKFSVICHIDEISISRNTQCKSKIMELWETVTE